MHTLAINTTIQMETGERMLSQKTERAEKQAHVAQMFPNRNEENKDLPRAHMHQNVQDHNLGGKLMLSQIYLCSKKPRNVHQRQILASDIALPHT